MCSASESSGGEKVWIREEGEYQDFPSNVFYLTVPNISVGGVFSVSFISLWKIWIREDGDIKIFIRIFFCLTVQKFSLGGSFGVSFISGIENVWIGDEGDFKTCPRVFFISQCRTFP